VDSSVPLELDDSDLNRVCVGTYKEHFENPFNAATEIYYRQESEAFSAANSVLDYFKKVEEWLKGEEDRVERCLDIQTRKVLIRKCGHALIR
jgi:cullin 1